MQRTDPPELLEDVESLQSLCQRQSQTISSLESQIRSLKKLVFGPQRERIPLASDTRQAVLFAEHQELLQKVEEQVQSQPTPAPERRRPRRRKDFPKELPRVRETCELPESERRCSCGGELKEMGHQISRFLERVEYTYVQEIDRVKYCCPDCHSGVITAPGPERVLDKSIIGDSLLSSILVSRFVHHMPYHRQEKKFAQEGLDLSRTVLCQAVATAGDLLRPVAEALRQEVVSSDYVKADETTSSLQNSSRGGKRTAYFWTYLKPRKAVSFDFTESRSRDGPSRVLGGFQGFLQVDGYGGYDEVCAQQGVVRVGCLAHVRRKFHDALVNDPEFAQQAIDHIDRLFTVDRYVRYCDPEKRHEVRNRDMPPLLEQFKDWLEAREPQVLPQGDLGKAIRYALNQWPTLITFLDDGRIDLDNNTAEQQIRHIVTGRKNWININNLEAGQRAADLYSLVQTCKLLEVNPAAYLRDVMPRVKQREDPATLTPAKWSKHQPADGSTTAPASRG